MYLLKNRKGLVRSGWLIFLGAILLISAQLVFSLPGIFLFESIRAGEQRSNLLVQVSDYPWIELMINGGGVLGSGIITILIWKFINKKSVSELGLAINLQNIRDLVVGLVLGGFSIAVIFLILLFTNQIHVEGSLLKPEFSMFSLTFFILFILVGFSEEIFFRGYIMKTMVDRNNSLWLSCVVSAVIFSIFHGANPNVTLFGLMNIGLVGFLFSYMYYSTGNLWMPIGYHITWNYFQGNVFGFPVSGTSPHGLYEITVDSEASFLTGGNFGPEGGILATALIVLGFVVTKLYSTSRI